MKKEVSFYGSHAKKKWRVQLWNQIKRRLQRQGIKAKDALVLYLPGKENLDLTVAREKGFKSYNLIGIERNPNIVKNLRKKGVNVIKGDIFEILYHWPQSFEINAVFADLMCGFEEKILEALNIIPITWKKGSVFCFNLQRGRESFDFLKESFTMKSHLEQLEHRKIVKLYEKYKIKKTSEHKKIDNKIIKINEEMKDLRLKQFEGIKEMLNIETSDKNRSLAALCVFISVFIRFMNDLGKKMLEPMIRDEISHYLTRYLINGLSPKLFTYRNSKVLMDSLVVTLSKPVSQDKQSTYYAPEMQDKKIIHRIAAARAIRTMRCN